MSARINPDSPVVAVVAVVATAGLAITSFLLSYAGLGAAAEWAHVSGWLAWAVPVTIDGSILVYTLAAFVFRHRGESARLAWASLATFASLSVIANGVHAWDDAPEALRTGIGVVVAGLAPIAVLITTHTLMRLVIAPPAVDAVPAEAAPSVEAVEGSPSPLESSQGEPSEFMVAMQAFHLAHAAREVPAVGVDERNHRIRELRAEGKPLSAIADEVGVSKSTVSRVLNPPGADAEPEVDEHPMLVAV
ncbi:DUF2637 domain-containing protein [Microbacterium trichothecenolyticum]|uniref:Helix-turn-helix domain of resolvase n=1 Tax=Microbacterium trichothecenolyticum TaxID=69370 RepID=A0A0M2H742_MICTR|nr:DUF2637 domain-containing protein [Microbacterium trichothecenolyticum]KJL39893.1 Helix-turn-helix domain of resolvase [Microbacterium trichothecenolyticum]